MIRHLLLLLFIYQCTQHIFTNSYIYVKTHDHEKIFHLLTDEDGSQIDHSSAEYLITGVAIPLGKIKSHVNTLFLL